MLPVKVNHNRIIPLVNDVFGDLDHWFGRVLDREDTCCGLAADLWEDDNNMYLELELPGVKREDVNINFENKVLRIEGQKKQPEQSETVRHLSARCYGKFQHSFRLSDAIDPENIDAGFKDGVLTVTLGKKAQAKPKKIEIKTD